jgi:hypothetical protein
MVPQKRVGGFRAGPKSLDLVDPAELQNGIAEVEEDGSYDF